jgi:hypothetical protein
LPGLAFALAASASLHAGNADAILVLEFTQQGADVQLNVSSSLTGLIPPTLNSSACLGNILTPSVGRNLAGCVSPGYAYSIVGPANFGTDTNSSFAYTGNAFFLSASSEIVLPTTYANGDSITGTGVFAGQTLSSLGLSSTNPGDVLGTWTVGTDSIEVRIGGGGVAVPGPLPLLGAAAAFAHSRRLRTRIRAGASTLA